MDTSSTGSSGGFVDADATTAPVDTAVTDSFQGGEQTDAAAAETTTQPGVVTVATGENKTAVAVTTTTSTAKQTSNQGGNKNPTQPTKNNGAAVGNSQHTHQWTKEMGVSANCIMSGYTQYRCSCGQTEKRDAVAALGHAWGKWVTTKRPTNDATGVAESSCSRCGEKKTKTLDVLAVAANAEQLAVLKLVNERRAAEGLEPLVYYSAEQAAADLRLAEIKSSFSHTRPNNQEFHTVLTGLGKDYFTCGENLASGFDTPEAVVEAWMTSKGHRANIMTPKFNALIVGVEDGYWVQLFLGLY